MKRFDSKLIASTNQVYLVTIHNIIQQWPVVPRGGGFIEIMFSYFQMARHKL